MNGIMPHTPKETFEELLREAQTDDNIIGFFLGGSRGKGYEHEYSDYDIYVVVKDEAAKEYEKKYEKRELPSDVDLIIYSFSDFKKHAAWGSSTAWDRYGYTRVKALVDKKGGGIQRILDEKGVLPRDQQDVFIHGVLNGYLNAFYRSVKSYRKKDAVGMRLSAAASIPYLLHAVFALHGRVMSYGDYLTRELKDFPLKKFPWSSGKLLDTILEILTTGDIKVQQELAKTVEEVFRAAGYNQVFDDWEGKDRWAMGYK